MKRVQIYSAFERFWHWLQALTIILLLVTGLEIHRPGAVRLLDFGRATRLHEALALFTIANAFLSLFYHLATGAIRQFFPQPRDFFSLAIAQVAYYTRGIFSGAPHPFEHGPDGKLNVLQQVTYLGVLNLVLPVQVATGILMWKAHEWARLVNRLGGLHAVATVHVLCAWVFGAFVVMHVYLTTTGRTPLAHLRAMVVGWEEQPEHPTEVRETHEVHHETT
jgi:thiosulfate reductase cytochrome b subunit